MRTLALAALLAGAAGAVKNPDTLVYLTLNEADSLDPAWQRDSASHSVSLNVYETLYAFEPGSIDRVVPLLAEALPKVSKDGRVWRMPIRKGVRFHDGRELTPEDARYSFLRHMLVDRAGGPSDLLLEPLIGRTSTRDETGAIVPEVWKEAAAAVTVEGREIVLRLPKPFAPLLGLMAFRAPMIVSKSWAAENGDWDGDEATWRRFNDAAKQDSPFYARANGTGPFKLERWDRSARQLLLVRHDGYWREPAKLARVLYRAMPELGTRKLMLQAGDADVIYADRSSRSQLEGLEGVRVSDGFETLATGPVVFFTYELDATANPFIGPGTPPGLFADKDMRLGFAHAIDAERFIADALEGKGKPASGVIPSLLGGGAGTAFAFDLKKAETHFRAARGGTVWRNGFEITIAYNNGSASRQIVAQMLKRHVEGLNPRFRVQLRALDWPAYLEAVQKSKLPVYVLGWTAAFPDAHSFAFSMLHSQGTYPRQQRFSRPELDRLVEAAAAESDPRKRRRLYAELMERARAEAAHVPTAEPLQLRVEREWVRGWRHDPLFPDGPHGSFYYTLWKE